MPIKSTCKSGENGWDRSDRRVFYISGEALQTGGKQVSGSKKTVTDSPYTEAKELVGGYILVNAKDMNEAVTIAKGCPTFEVGGKLEIRPVQKMEM